MKTYTAKFHQLPKYIPDHDIDFWSIQAPLNDEDDDLEDEPPAAVRSYMTKNPTSILGALHEARAYPKGTLTALWEGYGITIDDEKQTVTFTIDGLNAAFLMCRRVAEDYDADPKNNTGSWDELGLGGDDCVDYWGGYLHCFLIMLSGFAKAKGAIGIKDEF